MFYSHQIAITIFGIQLAKALKWESERTIKLISLAGIFHDIGLKDVPDEVISKPKKTLTDDENFLLESHPLHGGEVLSSLNTFPPQVAQAIIQHHENYCGTGYQFRLKGKQIIPIARLLYIVDLFSHYVVKSPHHKLHSPRDAIQIMKSVHYDEMDPAIFEHLPKLLKKV